jgi:hypothetical protein
VGITQAGSSKQPANHEFIDIEELVPHFGQFVGAPQVQEFGVTTAGFRADVPTIERNSSSTRSSLPPP